MQRKPNCATCQYCHNELSECRFSAPEALYASSPMNAVSNYAIWPKVMLDGTYWCREWRPVVPVNSGEFSRPVIPGQQFLNGTTK